VNDRKNLIKSCCFPLVALLSTLLIMAAISMLDLRGTGRLEVKIIRGLTKMTEAAKIAISRTEIITIKTKKEAAKGRMTTVPTEGKGSKKAWREKKF